MVCVVIASMRGASLHSSNLTEWRPALCVAHTQHTSNEKVGFFTSYLYHVNAGGLVFDFVFFTVCCSFVMMVMSIPSFFTDCRLIIDMGMPHLNGLERERLACLLARSRFVRDMPHRTGGIERLRRHHGALYNDIFRTSLFNFSLANH